MRNFQSAGRWLYIGLLCILCATLLGPAKGWAQQAAWTDPGQWQTTNSELPQQLNDVMAVESDSYVYVLGGLNNSVAPVSSVYYAKLNSGRLGIWQTGTSLPVPIGYSESAAAYGGYLYIFGGWSGSTNRPSETVYYAKLNANGSVGAWTTSTSLPGVLSDTTAEIQNGYAYVIGGMPDRETDSADVYYAKLNVDGKGSVGPWSTATSSVLASDADRSSVASNGYLYVFGGRDPTGDVTATISYAKLSSDGSIGPWQTSANPLPQAAYGTTAAVHNGYVYVIGGMNAAGSAVASIYYTKLNVDGKGSIGPWTTGQDKLPQGVNEAGSVISNGTMYVIGGWSNAGQGLGSTFYNVPAEPARSEKAVGSKKPDVPPHGILLIDGVAACIALVILGLRYGKRRRSNRLR